MRSNILLLFIFLIACKLQAQILTIHISNIRKNAGTIQLQVYTSSESFDKEKPLLTRLFPKTGMADGKLTLEFPGLKAGTYGIALLDDENNNKKMDYGLILPKEGFGFSNYYHTGMKRPVFTQFDFTIGNELKAVDIKIRYL